MKSLKSDTARRARIRTVLGHPALSVSIAISVALALTPSSSAQGLALDTSPTPTETTSSAATSAPSNPSPTPALPAPSASPSTTTDSVVVPTETLAPTGRTTALYPLVATTTAVDPTATPLAGPSLGAAVITSPNVHGSGGQPTTECGTCHRTHTAKGPNLLTKSLPQSTLCFTCHDGTGANTNVLATYTDTAVPQNDVADRLIYRHDTLAPTSHTSSYLNEFGGVSNRHSECTDCHNPHQAKGTDSTTQPDGVTASSRLAGVSGVSVVNGAAGTSPTYTFLPGGAVPITREYQLCFKCHSGFTTLDSNAGFQPSRYRLDKGIEFNPANLSYHPVEAMGRNQTQKLKDSLIGPSPYRQWNLLSTSVISCANCHSNYQRFNLVTLPSPNASSPLHASNTGGILRQNYRNRVLKPAGEAYKDSDFALCFMCHSNTPFANQTSTATNFSLHGKHLGTLRNWAGVPGTIDTPGAGDGFAICSECHFRQHSTSFPAGTQQIDGSRLVSFAPNVAPNGSTPITWTRGANGGGSCTLTCHGHSHSSWSKY